MGKKLIIFLGFTTAILAVILAVTPFSNLAVIPIVVAFICGLLIVFMSKKDPCCPENRGRTALNCCALLRAYTTGDPIRSRAA